VAQHDLFQLSRIDVEATPDDHVLVAAHDVEVPADVLDATRDMLVRI
jgi:hypothetical protein